ncbi:MULTISPECIES: hypothetical protein [Paenibacillus]|uniref:hypothetical protein n=1 Tax=Paenibacillus TaxID=44249 RepID=UPI0022B8DA7F|nr:hypothetical protein [Paenibacillus caseinilyticus]MCZ8519615.1 hypothetical protein [Paenibacillus caseinilyticus]
MNVELFFSVEETAVILRKEPRIIYQWLAIGELRGYQKKGRKSRWEIPASSIRPLLPGKVKEVDRLILDLVGEIRGMEMTAGNELLRRLMIGIADRLSTGAQDVERSMQKKQVCRAAGLLPMDNPGWEALALHELIQQHRSGFIGNEDVHRILIENDWMEWYEYATNELVCSPVCIPVD